MSVGCLVADRHALLVHRMQKMENLTFICAKIGKKEDENKTVTIDEFFVIIHNLKLIVLHFQCL